jgi:hypothetical protein
MSYTKQILVCPYSYSVLAGTLDSSNPPSVLRWLGPSTDIGFLLFVGLPVEPLHAFETSIVAMDILSGVALD